MKVKPTILYVEDEQWLMGGVIDCLSIDFNVLKARNPDQALDFINTKGKIDIIILDIKMPPGSAIHDSDRGRRTGVELARILIQEIKIKAPIICYTVVFDPAIHKELTDIGVKAIVSKKELPSELQDKVKQILFGKSNKK